MHPEYEIVRRARGRQEVIDRGSLSKMRDRVKQLRASTRGGRVSGRGHKKYSVEYEIRKAEEASS